MPAEAALPTVRRGSCPLCDTSGVVRFRDLSDRLGSVPGTWGFRQCPLASCGLLWLDPAPHPSTLRELYADYYTASPPRPLSPLREAIGLGYLRVRFGYPGGTRSPFLGLLACLHPGERQQLESSVMYLPAHARGRLLEVGFGNGARLLRLRQLGWEVEGVEIDESAVARARDAHGLSVRTWQGGEIPFPPDSFEAVIMAHVLEHLPSPVETLRDVARVLKPGGRLVVTTPNSSSLWARVFGPHYLHLDPPRHQVVFNPTNLRAATVRAGLRVQDLWVSTRNFASTLFASLQIRRLRRFPWRRPRRAGTKACAWALHVVAAGLALVRPHVGDELVLVARKAERNGSQDTPEPPPDPLSPRRRGA